MAALLVVVTILTSTCCYGSIICRHGGDKDPTNRFCYCVPGRAGKNCGKTVPNWTKNKKANASQSSIYAPDAVPNKAIDGRFSGSSMTKIERYPWWRVDLKVILMVREVQVFPDVPASSHGYDRYTQVWRVMIGVTSTGRYKLCDDNVTMHDCKDAVGYLVMIRKRSSTSELTFLAFKEVMVYGNRSSASPCLSNPCGNGGSCKPKDICFYRCVCPPTWSGLNCEGKNWARGRKATISGSNNAVIAASNTVDGNRDDVMRRGSNLDRQCVTTTRDVTSPWWTVEFETVIEVIQVYMVTRVESRTTDLLHCEINVGPHDGKYTKYYHDNRNKSTSVGAEIYRWFYVWCIPVSVGSTVVITYPSRRTLFESSFYAILSLCEVEVYGRIPPCTSNPCNNGGSCRPIKHTASLGSYECSCPVTWIGSNCEDIDPCMSNPCNNGDSCMENGTSYTCIQRIVPDPCASNPCDKGGICQGNGTSYTCIQRNVPDSCASNPCDNGGTCNGNGTLYTCFCLAAWTGTNCERTEEERKMSAVKTLLIGGGVVAVGAGSAATAACCCSSISCSDVMTKFVGVVTMKTLRKRIAENAAGSLDSEEKTEDEEEEEEEEEEGHSIWDDVCRSFSALVYGEEEVGDAVKASASDQQCA